MDSWYFHHVTLTLLFSRPSKHVMLSELDPLPVQIWHIVACLHFEISLSHSHAYHICTYIRLNTFTRQAFPRSFFSGDLKWNAGSGESKVEHTAVKQQHENVSIA